MEKKFSIGLTFEMAKYEFLEILNKYDENIKEVYFSLPLGDKYHTRLTVAKNLDPSRISFNEFIEYLKIIKSKNKDLCLALNTFMIDQNDVMQAIEKVMQEIEIDSIVTFNKYASIIKENFPKINLCITIHEGITSNNEVDRLNKEIKSVVIGNSEVRNIPLLSYIKNKGFDTKLLLNTGCSCRDFCKGNSCKKDFNKNLNKYNYNLLYAIQSIMPFELQNYIAKRDIVDVFKIANRDCDYQWLDKCLNSYINNINYEIAECGNNIFNLWGRFTWLNTNEAISQYNLNEIIRIKDQLWKILKNEELQFGQHSSNNELLVKAVANT